MGCAHSTVIEHTSNGHVMMMSNPVFTYRIGNEKKTKILKQAGMHGGLNQALRKNGFPTEGNSYAAIQSAYKHGLIDKTIKRVCCSINKDGNEGKHYWGEKKN